MNKPYLIMGTNLPGARIFTDRTEVESFAVAMSRQLADLLVIIGSSGADDGFIKSAIELATDMGYQVQQANAALCNGPDDLYSSDWTSPALTPPVTEGMQDFSAGQAHAVALLTEAASFPFEDTSWEALRKMRDGAPQNRFARKYLDHVIAQPKLLEGFSAVLSAALGAAWDNGTVNVSVFGNALPSEFEAGEVGADGTEDWTTDERPPRDAAIQVTVDGQAKAAAADSDAFLPPAAAQLVARAVPLLADAMGVGDGSDAGGRCIFAATVQLKAILQGVVGYRGGEFDPLDMVFDAESVLEGVAALHPADGRGGIVRLVLEELSRVADLIEKHRLTQLRRAEAAPVARTSRSKKKAVPA